MRKSIEIFAILFLLYTACFSQINWNLDYDSANFAFLIVDYTTYNFEGGYFTKFPYYPGYDDESIPFTILYNPPADFGDILFTYSATNDTIFAGSIVWDGLGQITFPDTIDDASEFSYDSTQVADPFSVSYLNYVDAIEDSVFYLKADATWMSVNKLKILKEFGKEGNVFRIALYLYAPAEGFFSATSAKWIIFLYRGQPITDAVNETSISIKYQLFQNYPNPFNPTTKISYSVLEPNIIILKVYDILGNEVHTMINQFQPAGYYTVNFNAINLPSGNYIYKLQVGNDYMENRKMLLLR